MKIRQSVVLAIYMISGKYKYMCYKSVTAKGRNVFQIYNLVIKLILEFCFAYFCNWFTMTSKSPTLPEALDAY